MGLARLNHLPFRPRGSYTRIRRDGWILTILASMGLPVYKYHYSLREESSDLVQSSALFIMTIDVEATPPYKVEGISFFTPKTLHSC